MNHPVAGIIIGIVGYGVVVSIILFEGRTRKRRVKSIIDGIRARKKTLALK